MWLLGCEKKKKKSISHGLPLQGQSVIFGGLSDLRQVHNMISIVLIKIIQNSVPLSISLPLPYKIKFRINSILLQDITSIPFSFSLLQTLD